jgi:putative endonuclease
MNKQKQNNLKMGELGEKFVCQWLISQDWQILAHRWRCLWGEIDIIAQNKSSNLIAFIEVKTRSKFNLDRQGIDSITMAKQAKLLKSAELFLTKNPQFADYFLRFDVALVSSSDNKQRSPECNFNFNIFQYIESAFEVD